MEDYFDEIWNNNEESSEPDIKYLCKNCGLIENVPAFVIEEEMELLEFCGESGSNYEYECPKCGTKMDRQDD